jgi:hypothetical protein
MTEAELFQLERAEMLRDQARKKCDRFRKRLFAIRDDLKGMIDPAPSLAGMPVNDTVKGLLKDHFPEKICHQKNGDS